MAIEDALVLAEEVTADGSARRRARAVHGSPLRALQDDLRHLAADRALGADRRYDADFAGLTASRRHGGGDPVALVEGAAVRRGAIRRGTPRLLRELDTPPRGHGPRRREVGLPLRRAAARDPHGGRRGGLPGDVDDGRVAAPIAPVEPSEPTEGPTDRPARAARDEAPHQRDPAGRRIADPPHGDDRLRCGDLGRDHAGAGRLRDRAALRRRRGPARHGPQVGEPRLRGRRAWRSCSSTERSRTSCGRACRRTPSSWRHRPARDPSHPRAVPQHAVRHAWPVGTKGPAYRDRSDPGVAALAADARGVVSAGELRACGLTRSAIARRVEAGGCIRSSAVCTPSATRA